MSSTPSTLLSPSALQHSRAAAPGTPSAEAQHPAIEMTGDRKSAAAAATTEHGRHSISHSADEQRASKVVFHTADEDEDYEDLTGTKPGAGAAAAATAPTLVQRHDGGRFEAPAGVPSSIPENSDDVLNMTTRTRARRPSFLENDENIRTVLVWQDLTVSSPMRGSNARKVLLDHVSGGMWAVMGPSGCGKSTLLNTLACRLDVNTTVSGEMRLNGRPYAATELKKMSGYVMQDDLLNPNLTVRETLYYTAALRLPASMDRTEREARIEEVIQEMGLSGCQNVIVGDPSKKGISGGERRRVCIGMELLTRPTLLFLDEPTSGLDSVTALALIKLLQGITRTGKCSMMISIHQPQAKLFAMFDRLMLLKSGRILFQGSVPDALKLFEDCGFPVPHYSNPADHLLDVITPPMDLSAANAQVEEAVREALSARGSGRKGSAAFDLEMATADQDVMPEDRLGPSSPLGRALNAKRKQSMEGTLALEQDIINTSSRNKAPLAGGGAPASSTADGRRLDQQHEALLVSKFTPPKVDLGFGVEKPLFLERENVSWMRQLRILMHRNFKEAWRKKSVLYTSVALSVIMAVLIGTAYLLIGTGQKSYVRRQPALFFFCINQGTFAGLQLINSFPAERALMLRERAAGSYYASAYFLAKSIVDTLIVLPQVAVFSAIAYPLVGLQPVASKFFLFFWIMVLCNLCATSLAMMVSAICKTTDLSVTVLPMALEVARLFGSFYLAPKNLPSYFYWLDLLSYVKYSYLAISLNELHGLTLTCTPSEQKLAADGVTKVCPIPDGQYSIDLLGLDKDVDLGGCIGALIGYIIFCRIVAYIFIRVVKST